jgi:eukaryotic-like serine/threonine-protein kinase
LEATYGFSANGKYYCALYSHEPEGMSFWVWDVATQKPVVRISQQPDDPNRMNFTPSGEFSPDCRLLASSGWDGTITIYDLGSGQKIKRLPGKRNFEHLNFSPGNDRLACFSKNDPSVEIREVESGRKIVTLACSNGVSALAWSPDGKRLATGCLDFHIDVWNAETGQRQAVLEGPFGRITSLSFSHAGNLLVSSGWDGISRLWNPDTGRQLASHYGDSWELQFSPDDRNLIAWQHGSAYGWLEVAYSRECRLLYVPPDGGFVSGPEFSADGRILAAASNTRVRFWDTSSGREIGSFREKLGKQADTLIFHPDGRRFMAVDRDGISVRSIEHLGGPGASSYRMGKPVRFFDAKGLDEAALSLDARHLAVTQEFDNQVSIFDLQNPSSKVLLSGHPQVSRVAISPDGHWVATAAWLNSLVKIWDAHTGEMVRDFVMPARTWVTFSPDGRWLALSVSGANYQLWEVGSWQPKNPPRPDFEDIGPTFTAFSPDGRMMARTDGHKIQLLETLTEKPLATLEAPGFVNVAKFKFSPDGCMLAAAQYDQQVQLWDLRLIRRELEQMHLDWDMPHYPPASDAVAASPVLLEVESDSDQAAIRENKSNGF